MGDDNRYATKEFWTAEVKRINDMFLTAKKHYDEDNYELALYYINQCIKLSNELLSLSSQHAEHEYAGKCITMLFRVFPDLYYNRALTYFEIGNLDMVEEYLNSDKIKKITYEQTIHLRSSLYLKNRQYQHAIKYFNEQIVLLEKLHDHQEKKKPVMKGEKQDAHTVMYKITKAHLSRIYLEQTLFLTLLYKFYLPQNKIYDEDKPVSEEFYNIIPTEIFNNIKSAMKYDENLTSFRIWKYIKNECPDEVIQKKLLAIFRCIYAIRMFHFSSCEKLLHFTKVEHITSFFHLNDHNCDASSKDSKRHQKKRHQKATKDKRLKYRAYNSAYMNDPREGVLFRDILVDQLAEKAQERDQLRSYWDELYDSSDKLQESKTYLLSFTDESVCDSIPMWIMYGDDSTGCCMSFNKRLLFTQKEEPKTKPKTKLEPEHKLEHEPNGIYNFMNHPDALSVSYYASNECIKGGPFYYNLSKNILELHDTMVDKYKKLDAMNRALTAELQANQEIIDIQTKYAAISAKKKELEKINPLVKIMLDQIRFLYKDKSFQHEKELRVVHCDSLSNSKIKIDNPKTAADIPKLYVDLNTNISYKDVTISIGAKVTDPLKISTYLKHVGVGKVELSQIKFW